MPKTSALPKTLAGLVADPENPRAITPKQLKGLGYSLEAFGDLSGIVFNRQLGLLVAGHQRVEALRAAHGEKIRIEPDKANAARGWLILPPPHAPIAIRFVSWAEKKHRAANLAANSPTIQGHFTAAALPQLDAVLGDSEPIYKALNLGDLASALGGKSKKTAQDDPEGIFTPPKKAITKVGDLYVLGRHRLLCGDTTSDAARALLLDGRAADCVFTDPPYAIYGSSTGIAADITDDKIVRPFFRDIVAATCQALKKFGHAYICCDWRSWASWWEVAKGTGFAPKNMIVWDKDGGGLGTNYQNGHELLLFGTLIPMRENMTQKMTGARGVSDLNVWKIKRAGRDETGEKRQHNAQKPLELAARAIRNSTDPGQLVVDWFGGSGTTLIAAEKEGRDCYAMEIDPKWCDLIVTRWETLTGQKAKLVRK